MKHYTVIALILLAPFAAGSDLTKGPFGSPQLLFSEAEGKDCCDEYGGTYKPATYDQEMSLCEYEEVDYRADFFLNGFCGLFGPEIVQTYIACTEHTDTCEICCSHTHDIYNEACGNESICLQVNDISYPKYHLGCLEAPPLIVTNEVVVTNEHQCSCQEEGGPHKNETCVYENTEFPEDLFWEAHCSDNGYSQEMVEVYDSCGADNPECEACCNQLLMEFRVSSTCQDETCQKLNGLLYNRCMGECPSAALPPAPSKIIYGDCTAKGDDCHLCCWDAHFDYQTACEDNQSCHEENENGYALCEQKCRETPPPKRAPLGHLRG